MKWPVHKTTFIQLYTTLLFSTFFPTAFHFSPEIQIRLSIETINKIEKNQSYRKTKEEWFSHYSNVYQKQYSENQRAGISDGSNYILSPVGT